MKWLEELLNDVEGKESLIKDIKSNLLRILYRVNLMQNDEVKELKEQVSDRDLNLLNLRISKRMKS